VLVPPSSAAVRLPVGDAELVRPRLRKEARMVERAPS
jgi:hypothetical protein